MRRLALACLTALTLAACQSHDEEKAPAAPSTAPARASTSPPPPMPAVANEHHDFSPEITGDDFAAHLRVISSDEYDGRKPGTLGERLTTNYIIEQFKRMGLEPGNKGDWIQTVPAVSTTLNGQDTLALDVAEGGGTEKFAFGNDMVVGTLQAKSDVDLKDSDIVFVGYGVDAPEAQWNDFDGIDVKGKTLVILVNDPGWNGADKALFKGREMTYYGRWTYKFEEAARKGAAAAFIVHQTEPAAYGWNVVRSGWTTPRLDLPESEDPAPRLPVAGWLTHESAQRLFAKAGKNFDDLAKQADVRGFRAVPLDAKASIHLQSTISHSLSNNVIGMVKGTSEPGEAIVYSAHWDHLGHDPALKGHQIYNGAIDNGTGIAAMLEIAGKFAQEKPKRSVIFAAVTMEESGLLGSKYYVAHPPFPLDKTVADINMDALPITGATRDMEVTGLGQGDLEDMFADVLKADGRVVSGDASPEKGHYFRSDHFNFAKAGVPALSAGGGTDMVQGGKAAGLAAEEDYTKNRYHQPTDVYDMRWSFDGVTQNVKAFYALGEKLANSDVWPVWKEGSEFKAVREKSLASGASKKAK
ncbi:Zn-dependent amino-or carboxypeptidase, M28 family [Luteibacter sp. UNC138MFCol5.1]|uniref:M28 family metallopeptidase n=1 Tax=Luteibacter sp. UNC138MFCol5.1 TaxID=1502774 RepID=UPI0008BD8DAA|nr:M28 family metallopeptidase [Luteibacter sp. UNC138MFCol5.1]SEO77685.1 Zn-dependent amino-or carboxypeptidase, M28 family [Luteibacter sp. UNC138MFCol5.1]